LRFWSTSAAWGAGYYAIFADDAGTLPSPFRKLLLVKDHVRAYCAQVRCGGREPA